MECSEETLNSKKVPKTPRFPRLITYTNLENVGACQSQLELFVATFPGGCQVSRDTILIAAIAGLDLRWAVKHFMSASALKHIQSRLKVADSIEQARQDYAHALIDLLWPS